jgi:hypothetical protein
MRTGYWLVLIMRGLGRVESLFYDLRFRDPCAGAAACFNNSLIKFCESGILRLCIVKVKFFLGKMTKMPLKSWEMTKMPSVKIRIPKMPLESWEMTKMPLAADQGATIFC